VNVNDLRPTLDAAADNPALWKSLVITALLWLGALAARAVVVSFLRSRGLPPTELRRLMATSRNAILFILAVATATVWFDELRTFAVSLVAVAAAIVIATKELIMGAGGTFLRTSGRIFDIGDRIEVAGLRGDVVDTSLFTTTIIEIGPGRVGHQQTGRSVTLPNALLLTSPVVNETWSHPFIVHTFEVPVPRERALATEALLLEACHDEAGDDAVAGGGFGGAARATDDDGGAAGAGAGPSPQGADGAAEAQARDGAELRGAAPEARAADEVGEGHGGTLRRTGASGKSAVNPMRRRRHPCSEASAAAAAPSPRATGTGAGSPAR